MRSVSVAGGGRDSGGADILHMPSPPTPPLVTSTPPPAAATKAFENDEEAVGAGEKQKEGGGVELDWRVHVVELEQRLQQLFYNRLAIQPHQPTLTLPNALPPYTHTPAHAPHIPQPHTWAVPRRRHQVFLSYCWCWHTFSNVSVDLIEWM